MLSHRDNMESSGDFGFTDDEDDGGDEYDQTDDDYYPLYDDEDEDDYEFSGSGDGGQPLQMLFISTNSKNKYH